MNPLERSGARRASSPGGTELPRTPYTPGRALARRGMLRGLLVGVGGVMVTGGLGTLVLHLPAEGKFIDGKAAEAFSPPTKAALQRAQIEVKAAITDAQTQVSQAFTRGESITLEPPSYLSPALAVVNSQAQYNAEWHRLARERGDSTKGGVALLASVFGVLVGAIGFFINVDADDQMKRGERRFLREPQEAGRATA